LKSQFFFQDFDTINYSQQDDEDEHGATRASVNRKQNRIRSHHNVDQNTRSRILINQVNNRDLSDDDDEGKISIE
jgi:hypothetical protein